MHGRAICQENRCANLVHVLHDGVVLLAVMALLCDYVAAAVAAKRSAHCLRLLVRTEDHIKAFGDDNHLDYIDDSSAASRCASIKKPMRTCRLMELAILLWSFSRFLYEPLTNAAHFDCRAPHRYYMLYICILYSGSS